MADTEPRQLSLAVRLGDEATFDNFLPIDTNTSQLAAFLKLWSQGGDTEEPFVYLGGYSGSGRSHLLQACCHLACQHGQSVQYFPLMELQGFDAAQLLEQMEHTHLICIDDVQTIAGDPEWEQALFHFYNLVRELGNKLLISGNAAPANLPIELPDLASRLGWGPVFNTANYSDEQKKAILCFRAKKRGFAINDEVANFLVNRAERGMCPLMAMLERLDQQSLEQQRMLTIPFVKQLFGF